MESQQQTITIDRTKPNTFAQSFVLPAYECDYLGRMTPGAILRHTQQIATDQCTALGMDEAFYRRTHTAFLLAKQSLQLNEIPRKGQTLTLVTMAQNAQHAVYKRITRLQDETGRVLGLVDGRWALVDTETRRVLRRPPEEFPAPWFEALPEELEQRILRPDPEQLQALGERRAEYLLCDQNGHLNNTAYADIVCNALPLAALQNAAVTAIKLYYHYEVPMGESFLLQRAQPAPGTFCFCGQREGRCCFEAEVRLDSL